MVFADGEMKIQTCMKAEGASAEPTATWVNFLSLSRQERKAITRVCLS